MILLEKVSKQVKPYWQALTFSQIKSECDMWDVLEVICKHTSTTLRIWEYILSSRYKRYLSWLCMHLQLLCRVVVLLPSTWAFGFLYLILEILR